MKQGLIIAVAVLLIAGGAAWYFYGNKKAESPYQSTAHFFDASQVSASDAVIKITDKGFEPNMLKVKAGTKVTFIDNANDFAWPASDPHPTHTGYPGFDPEEPLKNGQAWSFTFSKTGTWGFHDHLHPARRGTIVVE